MRPIFIAVLLLQLTFQTFTTWYALHATERFGIRPQDVTIGFIAAIGFSVGLFFSTALIPPGQLRSEINVGVLLSLAGLPLALMASWALGVGRFAAKQDS